MRGTDGLLDLPCHCRQGGFRPLATCHVIVDKEDFGRLPEASEMEEDMLDLAAGVRRTSRLSCQIVLTGDLDGLTVHIPPESRNMQGPR